MSEKPTGGPAFPEIGSVAYNSDWQNESGMTLRDWFAGRAMSAYCGSAEWREDTTQEQTAKAAYGMADAMLVARDA